MVARLKRSSLSECRVSARTYFPSESLSRMKSGRLLLSLFQHSLFQFLLALDAVASPRNSVQPFGVDFFAAGDALTEAALADALQRAFHHLQELPFVIC